MITPISYITNNKSQVLGVIIRTIFLFSFFFFLGIWNFGLGTCTAQVNAAFTSNETSGCGTLQVNFTNTGTTGVGITYSWNFGDGATSTLQNPGHTYLNPGTYTVSLTTSDGSSSDTETKNAFITVFPLPVANFTNDTSFGCIPFTVNFTDQSSSSGSSLVSWLWDFGDGTTSTQQNPQHIYSVPGTYAVTLFATDANLCTGDTIKTALIAVSNPPNAQFNIGSSFSCIAPFTLSFTNTTAGSGLTYNWNFGDPASGASDASTLKNPPAHTYNSFGDYIITLIVTNSTGCADTAVKTFSLQSFSASFSATDSTGCAPFSTKFSCNNSTATSFSWTFQGGSPVSSSAASPTINFSAAGNYDVTLIATNSQGCSDTVSMNDFITVFALPSVAISADDSSSCLVPFTVNFSPLTSADTAWLWTFTGGNPANSNLENPSVLYDTAGNFNVSLTVTDTNGCSKTITANNFIKITEPSVQFNASPLKGCAPLTVNFTDVSTSNPAANQWQWDFGVSTATDDTSSLKNPTYTYNDTGVYTVKLIIANAEGCGDTLIKTAFVMVGMKPNADFDPKNDSGCHKFTVDFTNLSNSYTDEWNWSFTNGITTYSSNQFSPTQVFADTGDFDVSLVVLHHGCPSDTLIVDNAIYVKPAKPIFTANPTLFCEKNTPYDVTITDASIGADEWLWNFGDPSSGTNDTSSFQNPPVHTYNSPGFYTIMLTVKNNSTQCQDSITTQISISDINVGFSVDTNTGCAPVQISFSDSSNTNSSISKLKWMFGDGINTPAGSGTGNISGVSNTTGTFSNPKHTYTNSGFYDVSLIITDQLGCMDTLTIDNLIDMKPLPVAGFTSDTTNGCRPLVINFSDTTNSVSSVQTWNWNFGNGNTDTLQNPTDTFITNGQFTVTLIVTDTFGCKDTIVKSNYINSTFPFTNFNVAQDTICNFSVDTFSNSSTGAALTYLWDFGDGTTDNTVSPTHTFSVSSDTSVTFNISLTATDSNGCDSTISKSVLICIPQAGFVAGQQNDSCPPFNASFIDSSFAVCGFQSFFWDFGDGGTITKTTKDAAHTYLSAGYYDVRMILTDKTGCKDTITRDSLIRVSGPSGSFTFNTDAKRCFSTVSFNATTQNAASIVWDFSDGVIDSVSGSTVTHTYTNNGSFTPILTLRDTDNCKVDIFPFTINVAISIITGSITSDTNNVFPETNILFTGSTDSPSPIVFWEWNFGDGDTLTSTADIIQKHNYDELGDYIVSLKVTDTDSCTATTQYKVTIIDRLDTVANVFTPNGDGKNDVFLIPNNGLKEHYIVIFNRWGEKIYENRAGEIQWYGKNFAGAEVPAGTYYYILQSTRENGEVILNKNYISLMR